MFDELHDLALPWFGLGESLRESDDTERGNFSGAV
jgi:hypothetical protein